MTILTDSQMCAAKQNQRYVGLRGAIPFGYLGLGHLSGQSPDLADLFWGEKFLEESDEASVNGVLFVAPIIGPFEVGSDAVRFNPIHVIDHREIIWVGNKRDTDEAMQQECSETSCAVQANLLVSEFVDARFEHFAIASLEAMSPH